MSLSYQNSGYLPGTSSIVHEETHQPLLSTLSAVVEVVVHLRSQGHKVVLVSSGAIGVGLQRMNLPSRPKSLSGKQVIRGHDFCHLGSLFRPLQRSVREDL